MTDAWPTISTTSLGAAKRQMNASIRFLFFEEDPLAIHTLAYASYSLLRDLSKTRGDGVVLSRLNADAAHFPRKKFWRRFSELGNALKHGDRTADAAPEEFNEILLLVCCLILREMDKLESAESGALWLWFHAVHFINIDDAPDCYWQWIEQHWTQFHSTVRQERLLIARPLYESLKSLNMANYKMTPEQEIIPWRLILQPGRV